MMFEDKVAMERGYNSLLGQAHQQAEIKQQHELYTQTREPGFLDRLDERLSMLSSLQVQINATLADLGERAFGIPPSVPTAGNSAAAKVGPVGRAEIILSQLSAMLEVAEMICQRAGNLAQRL